MTKEEAFDAIVNLLSGHEWDSDTLGHVANILTSAGAEILPADCDDDEDED